MRGSSMALLLALVTLLAASSEVSAQPPNLWNFQGTLTDSLGTPLNGIYAIRFRLFDAETSDDAASRVTRASSRAIDEPRMEPP